MTKQEALPIRSFIGLFGLVTLVAQIVVIPRAGATYAEMYPDVAYLEPLYVSVVALIGLEIALLAAWQLVSAAGKDRAPSDRPRRWGNLMAASLIFMAACFAGVFMHAGSDAGVGGPAMLFGLLGSLASIPLTFVLRRGIRGWFATNRLRPQR